MRENCTWKEGNAKNFLYSRLQWIKRLYKRLNVYSMCGKHLEEKYLTRSKISYDDNNTFNGYVLKRQNVLKFKVQNEHGDNKQ